MPITFHQAAQAVAHASTPVAVPADLAELQLLDIKAVGALVGLKSSAIQDRVRRGEFPEPVRMGARCTRWPVGAVRQWLQAQIDMQQEDVKQRQQARAKKASSAAQAKRQQAIKEGV
jgi:predicted DNA-binding transcriptional regulator AlpA